MSEIVVTSTTDTPEAVASALGVEADEVETDTPETPAAAATEGDGDGDGSESGSASGADANDEQDLESDDESESGEPAKDAAAQADKGKKKGGWQKKIDKLTRANYEANRELTDLRARLAAAPLKKEEPAAETRKAIEFPTAPDPNDKNADGTPKYQTYGDFLSTLTKWTKEMATLATTEAQRTALAESEAKVAQMQKDFETRQNQGAQLKKLNDDYQIRRNEAIPLYEDWKETVDDNTELVITPTMQVLMHTHPMGAHLAYWYGKNPAEVERIAALHPEAQKLELGYVIKTLETSVKSSKSTNSTAAKNGIEGGRKKSSAPKPLKVPGARSSASVKDYRYYENVPYEEYKKARESGVLK